MKYVGYLLSLTENITKQYSQNDVNKLGNVLFKNKMYIE